MKDNSQNRRDKIGEACVKESTEENLLGITFDQSLSFKQHVKALCKKASQKLQARSNATFCPKFPVLTPLWISRGLWYTACTATLCGSLQEDNGQQGCRRGCSDRPFEGLNHVV